MAALSVEIIWRGEVVGYINNPGVDNFHLYGCWMPAEGPMAEEFRHSSPNTKAQVVAK